MGVRGIVPKKSCVNILSYGVGGVVTRTIEELNYCYFVSSRPQCCHTFALSPESGFVSLMGSSGELSEVTQLLCQTLISDTE